jgi:hypothetical protein
MKHLLFAFAMIFVSSVGFSKPLDTPVKAQSVRDQIAPAVFKLGGSPGVVGCDPQTGEAGVAGDFVYCVGIRAQTIEALELFSQLYPVGTQINGVFITVKYLGRIEAQPRLSAGF